MVLDDLTASNLLYCINILENASGEDLSDLQEQYKDNQLVKFYFSNKNLGFSGGHNYLQTKCEAEFILLINPDIKFTQQNTIKGLFDFINSQNDIGAVAPKLLTKKLKPLPFDHSPKKGFDSVWDSFIWINSNKTAEVAVIDAAMILIRSTAFNAVQGFDDKFFMYLEAFDLCLRLRRAGWKVFYLPTLKVIHDSKLTKEKAVLTRESVNYFVEKHYKGTVSGALTRYFFKKAPVYKICKILAPEFVS